MAQAGSFVVTDRQEYSVESQSHPTWNDLHPVLPEPVTQQQALHHWNTKAAIRAMPRCILGIAILRGLGMQMPTPPTPKVQPITPAMLAESNRRIAKMREELAAEAPGPQVVDTSEGAVEELRDSVTRAEAQSTFEGAMRASELRKSLNS